MLRESTEVDHVDIQSCDFSLVVGNTVQGIKCSFFIKLSSTISIGVQSGKDRSHS